MEKTKRDRADILTLTMFSPADRLVDVIPQLDENGYLPSGIHPATLAEIEARFGRLSELRRVQMEPVRWMVELARRAGARRIVLNGSFTDTIEPNDVDCAILFASGGEQDRGAIRKLRNGLPFIDMALVGPKNFERIVSTVFASDRLDIPKGMIEVNL